MNSRLKKSYPGYTIIVILMLGRLTVFLLTRNIYATANGGVQSQAVDDDIIFKVPKGYIPKDFPEIKGVLILCKNKPSGMFIVYPTNDQTVDEVSNKVRETIKDMFIDDGKSEPKWSVTSLEPHQGISDENGTLALGTGSEEHIQIASYARTIGGVKYLYGYFAMQSQKGKTKGQNGDFLDNSGRGVKEFDEFWRSMSKRK